MNEPRPSDTDTPEPLDERVGSAFGDFLDHPIDPEDARQHLATATRRIIDQLVSSTATGEEFERARDLVEHAVEVLAESGHGRPYDGAEAAVVDLRSGAFIDDSPFIGRLNPLAAPIVARFEADHPDGPRVVGEVVFGAAYEGPPGCVHGGFIAGGFDEVLGLAQSYSGQPGMTAQLDISYRSPTPLHRPIVYVAKVDRIAGRKIHASATLHDGERLCAEAGALFVSMRPEVFDRLSRARFQRD